MTWIGGVIVAVFILGALVGGFVSRQREDPDPDITHADKLDYPADDDHKTGIEYIALDVPNLAII